MTEPPEAALVKQVADHEIGEFPEAMDHLVAAGLFTTAGELLGTGRNHYRPHDAEGPSFDYVHAEQGLIAKTVVAADVLVDLVTTLEPCDERSDGEESCAERIVALASRLTLRRVIAGCPDDARGVRILARAGIDVDLLVGPKLEAGRRLKGHVLRNLRQEIAAGKWTGTVRLLETESIDAVTDSSNARYAAKVKRLEDRRRALLEALVTGADAAGLLRDFDDVFAPDDAPELEAVLAMRTGSSADDTLALRPFVERKTRRGFERTRDRRIMEHERSRKGPDHG